MKTELKTSLSNKKTLLLLSFLSIFISAVSCVMVELILPALIGALSALYLFDTDKKRIFSIATSVVILSINLAAILFEISASMFGPAAIIVSFIISRAFVKGENKADTAYISTMVCSLFILAGALLFAMVNVGEYTIDAALEFYSKIADELKAIFVESMYEIYTAAGVQVTEELMIAVFDQIKNMIISYILIVGFVIVGLGMKIFSFITKKCSMDKHYINEWSFSATNVHAYFYVILALVYMFIGTTDSIFAISVMNLYNIFMVVFAYIGFNFVLDRFKSRMRPASAFILLVIICIMLLSLAMQVLALLGVMMTVRKSNVSPTSAEQ